MINNRKGQAGFSLAELLVAMVILAVALLGLAELQVTAMKQNSKSEQIMAAISLGQMVVEDVMNRPTDDPLFRDNKNGAAWSVPSITVPGAGTFNITYDTATAYQGIDNICLFTVYIRATNRLVGLGSQTQPIRMTTIKRFVPA